MIAKVNLLEPEPQETSSRPVLANEIEGVQTRVHRLPSGAMLRSDPIANNGRVFLMLAGAGAVRAGMQTWRVSEPALLVPAPDQSLSMETQDACLCLELRLALTEEDRHELAAGPRDRFPFFISYSQCKTYREKIKSPKTVNRTLLPAHTYPRLCVGSVETDGPDHVAAHCHPMLEQYFLGLPDNRCRVRADTDEIDFGPNELLHVPLGSTHSVDVQAGRHLHYIWIDVFQDAAGMAWIDEQHEDDA